ncbi:ATP-binding protein [Antarctobacter heliothermus]|uniref:histidine kinase n=1 Tax=Antarctobacter heliothermus TaxID=74033 RepID=A0A239KBQ7_9RHOB|nr:ATP-binding protein [Antarctobacter heliothermus]SNT15103.1 Signal transduction histidine kinase [Antarctobacter heliothermus]
MVRWLQDNARALRALTALCVAVALAVLLFVVEQAHVKNRAKTVHIVTAGLWSMSELHFESQRTVSSIESHWAGRSDLADVRLRFDILWSRVEVAGRDAARLGPVFDKVMSEYAALLAVNDSLINGADPPDRIQLEEFVEALSGLTLESRRVWSITFGVRDPVERFASTTAEKIDQMRIQWGAFSLIAILLTYVLAEVYFANRGQRREAVLRREAADANAAKTRFLANVSHEIRTPLNGILGMASELSETTMTDDQASCLHVIEQSGAVLLGTINDVLDLSRIEAGQLGVDERPFVLHDLVASACALYSARAREKELYLTLDIQANLPPILMGDDIRIRQVLHNLIANAVKFTREGGVKVRVRPDLAGRRLVIAVQDSGLGIDRKAQARIFEPFMQADSSITRQHGGSGLGLTISRQLCQAMGGDLMVVSRPGHGATFFCDLPLRVASAEEANQVRSEPAAVPELDGMRIMVADDNATNRLILSRFLAKTQAHPVFADTGQVAVDTLRETPCEVILMDVQMPVMDGVAATRIIRDREEAEGTTPAFIVAVTANVLSHQVSSYRAAGMDEVLSKPVSKRDLLALLGRQFPKWTGPQSNNTKSAAVHSASS